MFVTCIIPASNPLSSLLEMVGYQSLIPLDLSNFDMIEVMAEGIKSGDGVTTMAVSETRVDMFWTKGDYEFILTMTENSLECGHYLAVPHDGAVLVGEMPKGSDTIVPVFLRKYCVDTIKLIEPRQTESGDYYLKDLLAIYWFCLASGFTARHCPYSAEMMVPGKVFTDLYDHTRPNIQNWVRLEKLEDGSLGWMHDIRDFGSVLYDGPFVAED